MTLLAEAHGRAHDAEQALDRAGKERDSATARSAEMRLLWETEVASRSKLGVKVSVSVDPHDVEGQQKHV